MGPWEDGGHGQHGDLESMGDEGRGQDGPREDGGHREDSRHEQHRDLERTGDRGQGQDRDMGRIGDAGRVG